MKGGMEFAQRQKAQRFYVDLEGGRDPRQPIQLHPAAGAFPLANGLGYNSELLRKLLLRQVQLFTPTAQKRAQRRDISTSFVYHYAGNCRAHVRPASFENP
jgi:hypothetical protein